ncbi:unnamed protein product [Echinostoma caproni]|uniref:Bromo domain-containing protein n=1 Tax=Echinostoma caproni TaxID=27848 RepID=A0A183AMV4_9TREM|nr:unnamed protein product [Echinostoma caproni]
MRSSSRWRLTVESSGALSRTTSASVSKNSSPVIRKSTESNESSHLNTSASNRGRHRVHAKVGRPRLTKSIEIPKKVETNQKVASQCSKNNLRTKSQESSAGEKSEVSNRKNSDKRCPSDVNSTSVQGTLKITQEASSEPATKRPRGRPRSSIMSKENLKEKSTPSFEEVLRDQSVIQSKSEPKSENGRSIDIPISPPSICSPKLLKKEDLYCAEELRFGASDNVLQDLLKEINTYGVVPKVYGHNGQNSFKTEDVSPDAVFVFDVPVVKHVFENLWESSNTVLNLDTKDLFLALNGLLRPGVCELWRRRLEEQSKKLSRSHMGRLRPNPRPRRYSDMFVSSGDQTNTGRHPIPDLPVYTEKVRSGSRSVAVAAARLTAAKRLIRAKSNHKRGPRIVTDSTCGVSKKLPPIVGNSNSTARSRRKSQKVSSGVETAPRTRRRPDVSHHIDWKFCYAQSDKQNSLVNQTTPKRRRKTEVSPDKCQVRTITQPDVDEFASGQDSPTISASMDTSTVKIHREKNDSYFTKDHPSSDGQSPYTFELKKSLARLEIGSSADGRRKRRHALTVQRKRPIERPVCNLADPDHLSWRNEMAEKNDPLSDSSVTSVDNYDRPFRQSKWILPPTPRPKGSSLK